MAIKSSSELALFRSAVVGKLRTEKIISDLMPESEQNSMIDHMLAAFEQYCNSEIAEMSSVVDAVDSFNDFVNSYEPPVPVTIRSISINIIVPAGSGTIELGAQGDIHEGFTLDAAYLELFKQVTAAYDTFRERAALARPNTIAASNGSIVGSGSHVEEWFATAISVEERNGKRYYRVRGDKWEKFGVPIWDEVCKQTDIPFEKLAVGNTIINGYKAVCEMKDGKPTKISRLYLVR